MNNSVSVVVASAAGGDFLFRCLDSLREQAAATASEVIVADRFGGVVADRVRAQYPFVILLPADKLDHKATVPELRKMGSLRATGDLVAVIEEHCVAPPDWIETIKRSFHPDDVAIGGPILDDDFDRIRDWVVYFCEYHNYLPPWGDGPRYALNGANIVYRRSKLVEHQDVLTGGYWEVVLHPILAPGGVGFRSIEKLGVRHTGPFDYLYYLDQRFLLSRVWGGTQRERVSPAKRAIYLVVAPVLPALLLARITSRVLNSKVSVGRLIAAMPLLIPATITYVTGEWMGYLAGPGRALRE